MVTPESVIIFVSYIFFWIGCIFFEVLKVIVLRFLFTSVNLFTLQLTFTLWCSIFPFFLKIQLPYVCTLQIDVGVSVFFLTQIYCLQVPVDLVIDHSVQVDVARSQNAVQANMELEFHRNKERFGFLKWGSSAFQNMLVVPPGSGIVHQVILWHDYYPSRVDFVDL